MVHRGQPAPAANTTRRDGWEDRTSPACQAHHAAWSWAAYPTTAGHHAGSASARGSGASGPGCTSTGRPAASATASTGARRAQPAGVRTSVAGTWTPTNPPSSKEASPSRSGSTDDTDAHAPKPSGSAATPSCQASSSAAAEGPRSDSIPSGADRDRHASPMPSWAF
ncbi:hypothetical protein [Nocardioides islandensis]|uniref:hypothetical protein n=1 Tax=Nocardioides islandensis TaxID=433663 RepID=UPI001E30217F|nr:hypothetical protein [Nocardioides islandensis]